MNTEIIENFIVNDGVVLEPDGTLTVFDLCPCAVTWSYNGTNHRIENKKYKLSPLMLNDNKHIAIIEDSFRDIENKAYIVHGDGEIVWDLMPLLKERLPLKQFTFYDVYYIKDTLYFFVYISGNMYRFEFNFYTGKVGDLIESR